MRKLWKEVEFKRKHLMHEQLIGYTEQGNVEKRRKPE
jgi:hypothetical protein